MVIKILPAAWTRTTLGDSCLVIQGQSPPGATYNTNGVGLPFLQGKAEFGATYPVTVMSNAYGKIIANVEQLHRLMDEEGISAIVARSGKNFTYLAGFAYPGTLARQGEHNLSFHKE